MAFRRRRKVRSFRRTRSFRRRRRYGRGSRYRRRRTPSLRRRLNRVSRVVYRSVDTRRTYSQLGPVYIDTQWGASVANFFYDIGSNIPVATTVNQLTTTITSGVPSYRSGQKIYVKFMTINLEVQNVISGPAAANGTMRMVVVRWKKQNEEAPKTNLGAEFLTASEVHSDYAPDEVAQGAWDFLYDKSWSTPGDNLAVRSSFKRIVIPINSTMTFSAAQQPMTNSVYLQACATVPILCKALIKVVYEDIA